MWWLRLLGIVVLMLALADPLHAQLPGAKKYESGPGRFSVWMPGVVLEQKREMPGRDGATTTAHFFTSTSDRGAVTYIVVYWDLDATALTQLAINGPDLLFDETRELVVRSAKTKAIAEKPLTLGDKDEYPGREMVFDMGQGRHYRMRIYVVKDRTYQVVVQGPPKVVTGRYIEQFFDTFKVKAPKDPKGK